jgi:hypothetical protein
VYGDSTEKYKEIHGDVEGEVEGDPWIGRWRTMEK